MLVPLFVHESALDETDRIVGGATRLSQGVCPDGKGPSLSPVDGKTMMMLFAGTLTPWLHVVGAELSAVQAL